MNSAVAAAGLAAGHAAFIEGAVSISIASCDAALRPSVARGMGCRVEADGRVGVYVRRGAAEALLADVRAGARVAAVFSNPEDHCTLQLKGSDATIAEAGAQDVARSMAYLATFAARLGARGYPDAVPRAMLACPPEELTIVRFTPGAVFSQTPGPRAGERLP